MFSRSHCDDTHTTLSYSSTYTSTVLVRPLVPSVDLVLLYPLLLIRPTAGLALCRPSALLDAGLLFSHSLGASSLDPFVIFQG